MSVSSWTSLSLSTDRSSSLRSLSISPSAALFVSAVAIPPSYSRTHATADISRTNNGHPKHAQKRLAPQNRNTIVQSHGQTRTTGAGTVPCAAEFSITAAERQQLLVARGSGYHRIHTNWLRLSSSIALSTDRLPNAINVDKVILWRKNKIIVKKLCCRPIAFNTYARCRLEGTNGFAIFSRFFT